MPDIFVSTGNSNLPQGPAQHALNEAATEKEIAKIGKKGQKLGLLTTFRENPLEVIYDDLDPDEEIILFLRRHFITNFPWIAQGVFLIILPFLLSAFIAFANISIVISPNFILFSLLSYYFFVFLFLFLNFLNWFYNITLITNKKVVDVDFKVLISKNVAATKIAQIEDVSLSEVGLLRSIFDYGDVMVQTAGTVDNFEANAVPHPERVVHVIGDLIGGDNHA